VPEILDGGSAECHGYELDAGSTGGTPGSGGTGGSGDTGGMPTGGAGSEP
jgi:hypothetical protein